MNASGKKRPTASKPHHTSGLTKTTCKGTTDRGPLKTGRRREHFAGFAVTRFSGVEFV
jgi:hypothetical protein